MTSRSALRPVLLAAAAGLVLVAAFPPIDLGFLSLVALSVLLVAVWTAPTRTVASLVGLIFGVFFFGVLLRWLLPLGIVALVPMVLLQSLFPAAAAWWLWGRRARPVAALVLDTAAAWVVAEFVRSWLPFGGFPWAELGYSFSGVDAARSSARWIGVYGWSALIVGSAAAVAVVIVRRTEVRNIIFAPAALVLAIVLGAAVGIEPEPATIRVAIVQGENPCPGTHCLDERRLVYQSHLELTRTLEPGAHDLVVWAESSTGFGSDPLANPVIGAEISAEAVRLDAVILVGADRGIDNETFVNANVVFSAEGEVVGEYRKTHPVPFGEYIPLRPLFEWIPDLDQVPRDMVRGEGPVVFPLDGGTFGSIISYEAAYGRYVRATVEEGAQLIVVATNQSSYGPEASPQLIAMSRMHAAALGIDIVQAAVTGQSTIVRSDGSMLPPTGEFEATVLTGDVALSETRTLYGRIGEWAVLAALAWLLASWIGLARDS